MQWPSLLPQGECHQTAAQHRACQTGRWPGPSTAHIGTGRIGWRFTMISARFPGSPGGSFEPPRRGNLISYREHCAVSVHGLAGGSMTGPPESAILAQIERDLARTDPGLLALYDKLLRDNPGSERRP